MRRERAPETADGPAGGSAGAGSPGVVVLRPTEGEPDDAALVARVVERGDSWAEELLYRRHAARTFATAARLLGRRADAEDVVQDAFVTAFARLAELREPARFGSWLLTITVHRVYRALRRRRLLRLLGLERDSAAELTLQPAASVSAEQRAHLREVEELLRRQPAKNRIAWVLHHVEGCTLEEVAVACECSLATAKRRIAAAHESVAHRVGPEQERA